jgi:heme-binding NEAT domain protein
MIFNGKKMVQRIVSHEGLKPVVIQTQEGGEVKPMKVVKENKKADRARIAAELFKTL